MLSQARRAIGDIVVLEEGSEMASLRGAAAQVWMGRLQIAEGRAEQRPEAQAQRGFPQGGWGAGRSPEKERRWVLASLAGTTHMNFILDVTGSVLT